MARQITSRAVALNMLRTPGAEINMGSSSGKWLWTPHGRRRIHERLVVELESAGLIERTDDNRSCVGMTWTLTARGHETAPAQRRKTMTDQWHRCEICGRFIAYQEFADGTATHRLVNPDAYGFKETWETYHNQCDTPFQDGK